MLLRRLGLGVADFIDRVRNPFFRPDKLLYQFTTLEDLQFWKLYSDAQAGGHSSATLHLLDPPPPPPQPQTAVFKGTLSQEINPSSSLKRSGFAGIITKREQGLSLDIADYDTLVFKILSDGRPYIASLRTENFIVGDHQSDDVWQAFLFARKGEWQEVEIPVSKFVLTYKGKLVETRAEMNPERIVSVGLSVAVDDVGWERLQPPGDFSLGIEWIMAKQTGSGGGGYDED